MKKCFSNKKFRSLLLTGSFTVIIQYLMILSDTIIIGNILGEQELAAVNVIKPVQSFVIFVTSLISIGTSVYYSYEIGKFNKYRADCIFGEGIFLATLSGILLFLAGVYGNDIYFNYLNISSQVRMGAFNYYFYYQFVILLLPFYTVLLELVYADGDEWICNISSVVQILVNILFSVLLCYRIGILGVGLGSLFGMISSIAILLIHFMRKQNTLHFVLHFNYQDILNVIRCGMTDSSAYLFMGMTSFATSKFVLTNFGEYYLPILLVVFDIIELTLVFDGIGQAVTPIINVYRGEKNHAGIRRIMRTSLMYAIAEGIGLSILLYFFGENVAVLLGLSDAELIEISSVAIRLVSPFFFCSGILFLGTTYYMIIQKEILATVITGVKDALIPITFICIFGLFFGIHGVWIGLGLSPFVSVVLISLYILMRYGKEKFPLLLEKDDREIYIYDIELNQQNILDLRDQVEHLLLEKNIQRKSIHQVMLYIEEVGILIYEKNKGKKTLCECSIILGDDIEIILRDDGIIFDLTDPDNSIESLRGYVVAHLMLHLPNRFNLMTTGYNRNMFRFNK